MPSIDGLVSGLDTSGIIENLLAFQRQPILRLESQIELNTQKKSAITTISAKLLSLQLRSKSLTRATTFGAVNVASSNEQLLRASGGPELAPGTYRFKVRQLAQSEQFVSDGFASSSTKIGAGSVTIETGNGVVGRKTELDILNGGDGVRRGSIRITNREGDAKIVDLSSAVTVDDVVNAINNTSGLNVSARLATTGDTNPREAIVLTDATGGTGTFSVSEVNGGNTAADLGLLKSDASATIQGDSIIRLGEGLQLGFLNDGLGVRTQAGSDLLITKRSQDSFEVDLSTAATVKDVIDLINNATGNDDEVTVSLSGNRLVAVDTSKKKGNNEFTIENFTPPAGSSGNAATDLGLTTTASDDTITGGRILADLNSILLKTLNGGVESRSTGDVAGVAAGSIEITNRDGDSDTIDLSSAETLSEVIDLINANSISVTASLNAVGNGLQLTDGSGGTGLFTVEESGSTTARDLGILEATGVASTKIVGTDIDPQYIGENTRLAILNGGNGVFAGKIRVTDSTGTTFEVDLGQEETLEDVIRDINGAAGIVSSLVTASINDKGNGIKLVDAAAAGSLQLKVDEVGGGTTAADLGLLGQADAATPTVLDGGFEKTITIGADDTLADVVNSINNLGLRVQASISNDGSLVNPFRIQVNGKDAGSLSRVLIDSSGTNLDFARTASARDALLFYGSTEGGAQPVIVRSRTNTFKDVVNGLTVTALGASTSEVGVSVTKNSDLVKETLEGIVETYNELVADIREVTRFDAELGVRGLLAGEGVMRRIERQISASVSNRVLGLPPGKNLAANLGIRFQGNGQMTFDSNKFDEVLAADPSAIEKIFTASRTLEFNTLIKDFDNGSGIKDAGGNEIKITTRDGSEVSVDITGDKTVLDIITSFKNAENNLDGGGAERVTLSTSGDGRSFVLTDNTTGTTALKVEALNESAVAAKLGINQAPDVESGGVITGRKIDLTNDYGVAVRLEDVFKDLLDTETGAMTVRADFYQDRIEETRKEIERREEITAIREATLRREFAQLEVFLGRNQSELQRLSAALGSIPSF